MRKLLRHNLLEPFVGFLFVAVAAAAGAQTGSGRLLDKLKLEVRADGELFTTDSTPDFGLHGRYFNIMLGGDLGRGFSYTVRQRMAADPGSMAFFDNTDFLYLNYRPSQHWQLRFGKDAMALGGFEYDAPPIDVYFPTAMWDNIYCFQLAAGGSYISGDGNRMLTFQVSNSPYVNSMGLNYDAGLMAHNLYWSAKAGHWQALWSTSMIERKRGTFMNLTMIGNKVKYDKWDLYVDFMHHALSFDDWGKNFGFVSCANYYITPAFNLFIKGLYEQNKSEVDLNSAVAVDHLLRAGHTYIRYGMGVEYYPKGLRSVRLHSYVCRTTESYPSGGSTATQSLWNFNIGATWTMDFHRLLTPNSQK